MACVPFADDDSQADSMVSEEASDEEEAQRVLSGEAAETAAAPESAASSLVGARVAHPAAAPSEFDEADIDLLQSLNFNGVLRALRSN